MTTAVVYARTCTLHADDILQLCIVKARGSSLTTQVYTSVVVLCSAMEETVLSNEVLQNPPGTAE